MIRDVICRSAWTEASHSYGVGNDSRGSSPGRVVCRWVRCARGALLIRAILNLAAGWLAGFPVYAGVRFACNRRNVCDYRLFSIYATGTTCGGRKET